MFSGIIEEVGVVKKVDNLSKSKILTISCKKVLEGCSIGDSICVNGVCLTVIKKSNKIFQVDVVNETLKCTNLDFIKENSKINLERSLIYNQRISGHLVQGHVDGFGRITEKEHRGNSIWYTLEIPDSLLPYIVEKGSIALDGISLTIAALTGNMCAVAIIPHTAEITTFGKKEIGEAVNVEVDMLGKYVESLLQAGRV